MASVSIVSELIVFVKVVQCFWEFSICLNVREHSMFCDSKFFYFLYISILLESVNVNIMVS